MVTLKIYGDIVTVTYNEIRTTFDTLSDAWKCISMLKIVERNEGGNGNDNWTSY